MSTGSGKKKKKNIKKLTFISRFLDGLLILYSSASSPDRYNVLLVSKVTARSTSTVGPDKKRGKKKQKRTRAKKKAVQYTQSHKRIAPRLVHVHVAMGAPRGAGGGGEFGMNLDRHRSHQTYNPSSSCLGSVSPHSCVFTGVGSTLRLGLSNPV